MSNLQDDSHALEDVNKELDIIRQNYIQKLPEKIQKIVDSWNKLVMGNWDKDLLLDMRNMVHQIAGSGGTLGFSLISATARSLDIFIKTIIDTGILPNHTHQDQIEKYLKLLTQIGQEAISNVSKSPLSSFLLSPSSHGKHNESLIFLIDDDENFAESMALQLKNVGYKVRTYTNLKDAKKSLRENYPSVVIMDVLFPDGNGPQVVSEIQQSHETPLPVIFISGSDDLESRLQAVRAGGHAYFTKPVDMNVLLEKLDVLTVNHPVRPPHILIVDDDSVLAYALALTLKGAGMTVETVTDPMKVMNSLKRLKPSLILIDVSMPGCNGIELVAVIRQKIEYTNIPIVFLSAETDSRIRLEATVAGGDEYLVKPVAPELLILTVNKHLKRIKTLQGEQEKKVKQIEETKANLEEKLHTLEQEVAAAHQIFSDGELSPNTAILGSEGNTYIIQRVLGRGGMGVTYLGLRNSDQQKVAVKTLLPEAMSDVKKVMRFVQEARTILTLRHKNLVRGLDIYQSRGFCYLVMEFIDGTSVEDILHKHSKIDESTATEIVLEIARGLKYLELHHLVHRDIKPANIILSHDGVAKLVDFGIVKSTEKPCVLTTPRSILGTPHYVSPEQLSESNLDIRSDIYSLGATYYHMVVGHVPFSGDNTVQIFYERLRTIPKPKLVNPNLSKPVCDIIEKMMQIRAEKRHRNAGELIADLEVVSNEIKKI